MPFATYEELQDDPWITLIQEKFKRELSQLKLMRFTETYYIRETGQPFSIFPVLAYIIVNYLFGSGSSIAILRVGGSLNMVSYEPYLVHPDGYAYAAVDANSVKFATMFEDGTLLHTMNHQRSAVHHPEHRFIAQYCLTETGGHGTFKDTWRMHLNRVERIAKAHDSLSPLRVSDIIRMEMRADQILTGQTPDRWDGISRKKDED